LKVEKIDAADIATNLVMRRRVVVLVPCYSEEITIAKVVSDFRQALPEAAIYVYDNNSTDRTAATARSAGATVRRKPSKARATWSAGCSRTSTPTSICWSTATRHMTRQALAR